MGDGQLLVCHITYAASIYPVAHPNPSLRDAYLSDVPLPLSLHVTCAAAYILRCTPEPLSIRGAYFSAQPVLVRLHFTCATAEILPGTSERTHIPFVCMTTPTVSSLP
ncbi:unnamed protein product [Dicrocoelium dendriticum]|nr:unnamed protein product [Dicrocoelium dendriticum]